MKIIKFFVCAFLCISLFSCNDSKEEIAQKDVVLPFLNKKTIANKDLTTITSREELESVITSNYKELFSKIPSNELLGFIESMEYNERGITTFRYDYLTNNLSKDDLIKVFEVLFIECDKTKIMRLGGSYDLTPYDGEGGTACPFTNYRCMSTGTCGVAKSFICTCNC